MAVIDVQALSHRFGKKHALRDVSFSVSEGSVYALLGPNGAGKSTLAQLLMGLLPISRGAVKLFDTPSRSLTSAQRARIGYVAESLRLPSTWTLTQLERYLAPLYPGWDAALATSLRDRFALDSNQRLGTLSRGEHMKAALLCALAPRPLLLLMDEPFTGMDVVVRDDLVRGVLELSGQEGWAVLLASHDLSELEMLADHVGFLRDGTLEFSEPMDALRARYRWVEIMTSDRQATLITARPPQWTWAEASGSRVRVLLNSPDTAGIESLARQWYPNATRVEMHDASLRDLFVALTREKQFQTSSGGVV